MLDPPGTGEENMARDLALLRKAELGSPGARVYSWVAPWVTLGRSQRAEQVLIDPAMIPWITRPTGGGAVLHGHDVTFALAFSMRRSVRGSYRLATMPVIEAFARLGFDVGLGEDVGLSEQVGLGEYLAGFRERRDSTSIFSGDCFARVGATDLVDKSTRQKVCGCALRRTDQAVLLQASIPIRLPDLQVDSVLISGVPVRPVPIQTGCFAEALRSAFFN